MIDAVDLLVVAAHPDDAEISVGGTLLVAKAQGHRTAIVDLTRGELSSRGDLETRARETATASERLGLDHRENLDLGDGDVRDSHEGRQKMVDMFRKLRPRTVLAPYPRDLHADHAGAGLLVRNSLYLSGVKRFAGDDPPHRPERVGFYMLHTPFEPSAVVDVSAVWERKLHVIGSYPSQFLFDGENTIPDAEGMKTKVSSPGFIKAIEGRAREHGMLVGCEYGEPVLWFQPVKITDPVTLCSEGPSAS